jgi:Skp family chaperone for outer membrane proteins
MKFFFLSSIFFFATLLNSVNAEQKVVFLDMERVISTSNSGLSVINQLKDLSDKNLVLLSKQEKNFKEKETKLISQKNIISESEFVNKAEKLKKEMNELNKSRNKIITDFNKLKIENTNELLKMINPILIKFSKDNSISLILQKKELIIGNSEFDITDEILKIVNNEVKIFKIK